MSDPVKCNIDSTNQSAKTYAATRNDPEIVLNHLQKFTQHLHHTHAILDLGCGHGRDCKYFEDNGFKKIIGIDGSKEMLDIARSQCSDTVFIEADITNLDLYDMRVDAIWSCALLHHIPGCDLTALLARLKYKLFAGGIMFLTYKIDSEGLVYRNDLGVSKYYFKHSPETMKFILKSLGFEILEESIEYKSYTWYNILVKKRN